MLATLVGLFLAGDEADYRGPTLPFIIGVVAFVCGLILAVIAPSMLVFVLSRAVQGFGAGILVSVIYACVGQGYPEQLKPRGGDARQRLGNSTDDWHRACGYHLQFFGWRSVFLGLVFILPLGIGLVLPALRKLTPLKKKREARTFDVRRLLATAGLVAGAGMALTGYRCNQCLLLSYCCFLDLPQAYHHFVTYYHLVRSRKSRFTRSNCFDRAT